MEARGNLLRKLQLRLGLPLHGDQLRLAGHGRPLVLAVIGLMNLAWMAVFAAPFFLEKNWRHGVTLSRVSGAACMVLGLAIIARPDVLHFVSGPMA